MKYLFCVIAFVISAQVHATPFSMEGYDVDAYVDRTIEDPWFDKGRISGFGLDEPFTVVTGTSDEHSFGDIFKLNVEKDGFTLQFLRKAKWANGIVFRLIQPDYATTTTAGFWDKFDCDTNLENMGIDFGPGWVALDLSLIGFDHQSYITGHFNYKEVNEPAGLLLLMAGLFALASKYRKQLA